MQPIREFIRTHLDPVERLGEILFGLIMALGFTGAVRLGHEEADNRALFLGILGCNVAWGIVDGVMYVLTSLYERGRRARVIRGVVEAGSEEAAREGREKVGVRREDFLGGTAAGIVVILATLPMVVPYLIFRNPELAVRVSHATGVTLLFLLGASWGKEVGASPWRIGSGLALVGMVLVGVTILLGG
jgi:VIT1/CCC1 family predicted Fe2+/Mn2+ transporter